MGMIYFPPELISLQPKLGGFTGYRRIQFLSEHYLLRADRRIIVFRLPAASGAT